MLGVITSEAPFLRWIGPHIPLKSVQKLFNGEDLIFEHGSVAVQNMRTDIKTDQLMDTNRGERDDSKFLSAPRIEESTA